VKKDPFPGHFASFIQRNDIRREFSTFKSFIIYYTKQIFVCLDCVIDMQGTKKVEIPEAVMRSIMKVVLDDSNYPLLIHCNHGKVCILATPCRLIRSLWYVASHGLCCGCIATCYWLEY
jgi:tyrosine-protein phosphatase SIW14